MLYTLLRTDSPSIHEVSVKPDQVWRWGYDTAPPSDAVPIHQMNARLEEIGHDWNWHNGVFKYSGITDGEVWLLLGHAPSDVRTCCGSPQLPESNFCPSCGKRL